MRSGIAARWRSVGHAVRGLRLLLRQEPNARVHADATVLVMVAGVTARLTIGEWRWLVVAAVLVWSAEAMNTAIECVCDRVSPAHDPLIGAAKDVAAGAVLVAAAGAAILGATVFLPHLPGVWR